MVNKWKSTVVDSQVTVKQALKTLDDTALRIILVCDDDFNLLGVVTDGDIRRSLLRGYSLDSKVFQIMNTSPKFVSPAESLTDCVRIMQDSSILAIPIVDHGKVVGLHTLQKLERTKTYANPVFIMAGGFGTRLRPLTDDTPKPMLKVGEKPILEILINRFKNAGFYNFYVSTHYLPEKIKGHFSDGAELGVNITYVHEEAPLGTGGALGLLPNSTPELPLIMINGDVLTSVDFENLLSFHVERGGMATMCVREYEYQVPYGVITGDNQKIISMEEKPIQRFFVNAGIYVLEPNIYKESKSNEKIDMPNLLQRYIDNGNEVAMFPIHEYWLDIGRMDDFRKAQIDIQSLEI